MSGRRRGGGVFQPRKEFVAALDPSWTARKCCETQNPALRGMLEGDLPRHLKCQSGRGCIQRYGTKLLFAWEKPEEYVDDDEEDAFAYISAPPLTTASTAVASTRVSSKGKKRREICIRIYLFQRLIAHSTIIILFVDIWNEKRYSTNCKIILFLPQVKYGHLGHGNEGIEFCYVFSGRITSIILGSAVTAPPTSAEEWAGRNT